MPRLVKDYFIRRLDRRYPQTSDLADLEAIVNGLRDRIEELGVLLAGQSEAISGQSDAIARLENVSATQAELRLAADQLKAQLDGSSIQLSKALTDLESRITRASVRDNARTYRQAEALDAIDTLLRPSHPLPPLGGWALSADVSLFLIQHVLTTKPGTIVELGSGASTVLLALAIEQNASGRLITLEHSPKYLE
jgi:hypothetical protein